MKKFALLLLVVFPVHAADEPYAMKKIKHEDLKKLVIANKGKVVVVDFWNAYCVPCMKGIRHTVELKKRLNNPDFVTITVSLDPPTDEVDVAAATKFLTDNKINLTNFLFDEKREVWEEKLKIMAFPCVFVFNRAGQIEHRYNEEPKPAEFDALIEKLLKEKAP
jgi:thiol-disulfide isomerase/thioredoxin